MIRLTSDIVVRTIQHVGGDSMVVAAAKVSTSGEDALQFTDKDANYGLIKYLMTHRHGCFDSETEVLTSDGWKHWPDVTGDELFITLNIATDEIEYQHAERVIHKRVDGPMIRIQTSHVDALVTPDHNMLAAPRSISGWHYGLYPAKDFLSRCHRVRLGGGIWSGSLHTTEEAAVVGSAADADVGRTDAARQEEVKVVDYHGDVHCVTVPNGTLYVRRNGKPMWCGNTPFEHNSMTFFVHAPIFVWREWHRHRVGFCLGGDTQVWTESFAPRSGRTLRKQKISDLCRNWNIGVTDNMGRTRLLPSVRSQKFRVLNERTLLFESAPASDVFESGTKEIYLLETDDPKWNRLQASADHRIFTPDGWAKLNELNEHSFVYINGKRNSIVTAMPPSLRSGIGVWTSMQRHKLIRPTDRCYNCNRQYDREQLQLDHVVPVAADLTKALDIKNLKPCCKDCHRIKSATEQKLSVKNRAIAAGAKLAKVRKKPHKISEGMTYDISIKGDWHNFVADGFVVHNSFNEESARYKKLEPVFWIPRRDRPMKPVEGYKPARPEFEAIDAEKYDALLTRMQSVYEVAYKAYEDSISDGVSNEVSRAVLPNGIYSSCWVTCNARSLMHFLSLRTHESSAMFVSYPQREIEEAARVAEMFLQKGWPLTYKAFNECGRVGP